MQREYFMQKGVSNNANGNNKDYNRRFGKFFTSNKKVFSCIFLGGRKLRKNFQACMWIINFYMGDILLQTI